MTANSWTAVRENIIGSGGIMQFPDAGGAVQTKRFYRVVVVHD